MPRRKPGAGRRVALPAKEKLDGLDRLASLERREHLGRQGIRYLGHLCVGWVALCHVSWWPGVLGRPQPCDDVPMRGHDQRLERQPIEGKAGLDLDVAHGLSGSLQKACRVR